MRIPMKQPGWLMESKAVFFCGSSGGLLENHGNTGSSSPWPSCRFCWNDRNLCYFFFQVHFLVFFLGGTGDGGVFPLRGGGFCSGMVSTWVWAIPSWIHRRFALFPPKKMAGPRGEGFFQVCFFVLFGDKKPQASGIFFQANVFFFSG